MKEIKELARIAWMHPHTAYAAFTHGLQHRYNYVMRTIPNIENLFVPLENAIRNFLLPALLNGYVCNDVERKLFSLPVKFGGLGIFNPIERSKLEYENSRMITTDVINKVYSFNKVKKQDPHYDPELALKQQRIMNELKKKNHERNSTLLQDIKNSINDPKRLRTLEASLEKGASNWLTSLPIKENGFYLEKQAFWDSLYIRYQIELRNLPSNCVCGKLFTIEHAFSCHKGGFINIRHNEVRDFTADLLAECHANVKVEPDLTVLSGEQFPASTITNDEARVDIAARGVWIKGQTAFFDVRVFNPIAKSYLNSDLASAYRSNEQSKKRAYNRRILSIDQGSFTPLVFSCFGGMGRECAAFYNRLSERISEKRNIKPAIAKNFIRTRLNFHLFRACLLCIRGSRISVFRDKLEDVDITVVHEEANLK